MALPTTPGDGSRRAGYVLIILTFAVFLIAIGLLVAVPVLPTRIPLAAGQSRLTLVRTVFADNQPTQMQVIAYRVRDGVLTRRE